MRSQRDSERERVQKCEGGCSRSLRNIVNGMRSKHAGAQGSSSGKVCQIVPVRIWSMQLLNIKKEMITVSNIIYVCPECGDNLIYITLDTSPPTKTVQCKKCGWSHTEEPVYIPYPVDKSKFNGSAISHIPPACQNCRNHPSNGGSGICSCTLAMLPVTC